MADVIKTVLVAMRKLWGLTGQVSVQWDPVALGQAHAGVGGL